MAPGWHNPWTPAMVGIASATCMQGGKHGLVKGKGTVATLGRKGDTNCPLHKRVHWEAKCCNGHKNIKAGHCMHCASFGLPAQTLSTTHPSACHGEGLNAASKASHPCGLHGHVNETSGTPVSGGPDPKCHTTWHAHAASLRSRNPAVALSRARLPEGTRLDGAGFLPMMPFTSGQGKTHDVHGSSEVRSVMNITLPTSTRAPSLDKTIRPQPAS